MKKLCFSSRDQSSVFRPGPRNVSSESVRSQMSFQYKKTLRKSLVSRVNGGGSFKVGQSPHRSHVSFTVSLGTEKRTSLSTAIKESQASDHFGYMKIPEIIRFFELYLVPVIFLSAKGTITQYSPLYLVLS